MAGQRRPYRAPRGVRLGVDSEVARGSWAIRFDHHVCRGDQLVESVEVTGIIEVKHHEFLVRVVALEDRRRSRPRAATALDLHDAAPVATRRRVHNGPAHNELRSTTGAIDHGVPGRRLAVHRGPTQACWSDVWRRDGSAGKTEQTDACGCLGGRHGAQSRGESVPRAFVRARSLTSVGPGRDRSCDSGTGRTTRPPSAALGSPRRRRGRVARVKHTSRARSLSRSTPGGRSASTWCAAMARRAAATTLTGVPGPCDRGSAGRPLSWSAPETAHRASRPSRRHHSSSASTSPHRRAVTSSGLFGDDCCALDPVARGSFLSSEVRSGAAEANDG